MKTSLSWGWEVSKQLLNFLIVYQPESLATLFLIKQKNVCMMKMFDIDIWYK